jgi:hypothetical protein
VVRKRRPGELMPAALAFAFVAAAVAPPYVAWVAPAPERDLRAIQSVRSVERYQGLVEMNLHAYRYAQVGPTAVLVEDYPGELSPYNTGGNLSSVRWVDDEPAWWSPRSWVSDPWSWRFSWSDVAPAVPAMLLVTVFAALAAGRDPEEYVPVGTRKRGLR